MGSTTAIEWADRTFNPWSGCQKVSPACANCYAEKSPGSVFRGVKWGPDAERVVSADSTWKNPLRWNRKAERDGTSPRVFCGSLCDVFEARDDLDEHRARLWDIIEQTPRLTWLLLTKRPEQIKRRVPIEWWCDKQDEGGGWYSKVPIEWPSNVWIGCTVEDQQRADERIPHILRIPSPVRFLSMEPLLGPVDLSGIYDPDADDRYFGGDGYFPPPAEPMVQWVITGGESGPKARPSHPDWFRSLRDQCQAAGVAYFHKQHGEFGPTPDKSEDVRRRLPFGRGTDEMEMGLGGWVRAGKKAAGTLLDGREWRELPR